jgi:hypothetical protein
MTRLISTIFSCVIVRLNSRRNCPFMRAERAALALTESSDSLGERANPIPDEIWDEAARCYAESVLGALIIASVSINAWNRINVTIRQVAGGSR